MGGVKAVGPQAYMVALPGFSGLKKFNKSEESTAKDENNQDSNNDETKNENQDLDVTVIKDDDAQVVKDNDDDGLIDIASFGNELKKMFGGKNGFF